MNNIYFEINEVSSECGVNQKSVSELRDLGGKYVHDWLRLEEVKDYL